MDNMTYGLILFAGAVAPGSAALLLLLRKGYSAATKLVVTLGIATIGTLCGWIANLLVWDLGFLLDLGAWANRLAMVGIALGAGLAGPGVLAGIHQLGLAPAQSRNRL